MDKFLDKHRPPVQMRRMVDLSYRIENQSVEIFEVRPCFENPKEMFENPVAKATYVKSRKIWKIYWQRKDLNWHIYKPQPEVKYLEEFLDIVVEDKFSCFSG
ncbi:MAG: DUF3024 domain-containing protein [Pseudomonadales bacterium]|nr:DUF3024 domain-containing protein [Pseudomonadales bacterium]